MIELLEGRFFKTFIAVLEEKSFSRAADKLGYVQSTVTAHIQALETACGKKLFHRLSRGVKPTEAGVKLSSYAYRFLQLGHSLADSLSEEGEPQGAVSIRMPESFFLTRMPAFLQLFLGAYPKVRLRPECGFQPDIVQQVLEHSADFGIVPRHPQRDELEFLPLVAEPLVFIAAPALAAQVEAEGVQALQAEIVISFGSTCLYATEAAKALQAAGLADSPSLELPSTAMIKAAVLCGVGFALVPEIAAAEELAAGSLCKLQLGPPIVTTHGLIVRKDRELTAAAALFRAQAIGYFAGLGE